MLKFFAFCFWRLTMRGIAHVKKWVEIEWISERKNGNMITGWLQAKRLRCSMTTTIGKSVVLAWAVQS